MLKKATDFVNTKSVDEALINFIRMAKVLTGDSYIVLREKIHFTVIKNQARLHTSFAHLQKITSTLAGALIGMSNAKANNIIHGSMAKVEEINRKFEYIIQD